MTICPKCGKKYRSDKPDICMMSYGQPARKCEATTVPYTEPEPEPEIEPEKDKSLLVSFPEPNLREDLKGQADLIHDLIEESGPMTYAEIGEKLFVSPKRASNNVSVMIRDGVELKREGSPRKVSLG